MNQLKNKKGFTLLELLIVIAIIAILATILVLVLNPSETLKKSRDAQRISDLATMKTAIGLVLTASSSPILDGGTNATCYGGGGTVSAYVSGTGVTSGISGFTVNDDNGAVGDVDGTGWLPVNFSWMTGGSPISNLPLDPTNTAATTTVTDGTYMYRYACKASPLSFEINAALESTAYTSDDPKITKDGGNNSSLYEIGTDLTILP